MSTGNAIRIRIAVTKMFQVKIGIRNIVMPGARMQTIVVIKLTAAEDRAQTGDDQTDDPQVARRRPGEWIALDSGV